MYTNKMIIKTEKQIFKVFNYNLMIRDYLLEDKVGLFLEYIQDLLLYDDFVSLTKISFNICLLLFEKIEIIRNNQICYLAASIIQSALVIAIKKDGNFPVTMKCNIN